ncbi:MAG: cephalosporin hydroxylase family protein [Magnetococcus sp. MYC-9]
MRKWAVKAALNRRDDRQAINAWGGVQVVKFPSDCFAIQALLCRCRPQVVVELGSYLGGSASFMASFAHLAGIESIVSVDIGVRPRPAIPIVTFLVGDTTSPEIHQQVVSLVAGRRCALVVDSNHHAEHVSKELALYAPMVSPGQAMIMEDTLVDVLNFKKFRQGGGPLVALRRHLQEHPEFERAQDIEPYLTTNFYGYLVKKG